MTLHIGYLIQQFPPEVGAGAARAAEMAAHWIEQGAAVTILTGMPNRPEGRIHSDYRGRFFWREKLGKVDVRRSWLYASPKHGIVRTLANNVSFMFSAVASGIREGREMDVLIASSPPLFPHISGAVIAARLRIPLVLELRDLWPDYVVEMGMLRRGSPAARALFSAERRLLRRAQAVTVVTESFRRRVIEKGVDPSRVFVMPNGVDTDFYRASEGPPPLVELSRRTPEEFLVGYLGNFGAGQSLSTVVAAAEILSARAPDVRIVLVGDGPDADSLRRRISALGLSNISMSPPIAKNATPVFYGSCDVCLVPLAPIPVFQETVPSKIFEIMACEVPVLASLDGEGKKIVMESGGGLVSRPGDAAGLAEGILRMRILSHQERRKMGELGRAYVTAHYERRSISRKYLNLLARVATGRAIGL
jgi:glycosyltransferase involved in cell wall biosynthesis